MTIQLRPTLIQFANGSQQNTAAQAGDPAWANIDARPGRGGTTAGANDAFYYSGAITNVPFNAGSTGNCGVFPVGNETKFRLKNSQVTADTTLGNDWYMYYRVVNCTDCNCNCSDCANCF